MNYLLWCLCTNSMNRFFLIGRIMLGLDLGVIVIALTLTYVGSPSNKVLRSYPLGIRARLLWPSKGWQTRVHSDDIEALRRMRRMLLGAACLYLSWNTIVLLYFTVLSSRLFLMQAHGQCG